MTVIVTGYPSGLALSATSLSYPATTSLNLLWPTNAS